MRCESCRAPWGSVACRTHARPAILGNILAGIIKQSILAVVP